LHELILWNGVCLGQRDPTNRTKIISVFSTTAAIDY
jgi:hypothetical protein